MSEPFLSRVFPTRLQRSHAVFQICTEAGLVIKPRTANPASMVCDDHFGPDPESLTTYIGYGLNFGLIFDQDTAHRET